MHKELILIRLPKTDTLIVEIEVEKGQRMSLSASGTFATLRNAGPAGWEPSSCTANSGNYDKRELSSQNRWFDLADETTANAPMSL